MPTVEETTTTTATTIKTEPGDSKPTLTPPASEEADKLGDASSELSELDFDSDDIGDVEPDHYYEGGRIPVFKPVCDAPSILLPARHTLYNSIPSMLHLSANHKTVCRP